MDHNSALAIFSASCKVVLSLECRGDSKWNKNRILCTDLIHEVADISTCIWKNTSEKT